MGIPDVPGPMLHVGPLERLREEHLHGLAQELLPGVAEKPLHGGIQILDDAVAVHDQNPVGSRLEHGPVLV
jgi:hypothetical protein